ncbi:MAG TPA: hypothetical protein OIL78_01910 [Coriobacteriaceae bacterium]|nr:hypothetical protein [Coriobacteriaceae bacterium]
MSVELPKDAEGRKIPLDTQVLYDGDGIEFFTDKSMYMRVTDEWWFFGHFGSLTSTHRIEATKLHLTPPDSWEKLEEDLGRGAGMLNYEACAYFGKSACDCSSCIADKGETCERVVMRDIVDRIRKLRGVAE